MTAHYHLTNSEETAILLQIWYPSEYLNISLEEHPGHTPESISAGKPGSPAWIEEVT